MTWGYRSNCKKCKIIYEATHLSNSDFWGELCPKCGNKMKVSKCNIYYKRTKPYKWYNPFTWFAYKKTVEFE